MNTVKKCEFFSIYPLTFFLNDYIIYFYNKILNDCPFPTFKDISKQITVNRVQIQDKTGCISYSINILGKGIHSAILPSVMSK